MTLFVFVMIIQSDKLTWLDYVMIFEQDSIDSKNKLFQPKGQLIKSKNYPTPSSHLHESYIN